MFSKGQLAFAIFFVIAFVGVIVASYAKDKRLHRKNFKGAQWVLIIFVVFLIFLLLVKQLLKN